jgi:cytidine deaminase
MSKKISISIEVEEFEKITELEIWQQELLKKAEESAKKAYAPYSQFCVGAALLLENGIIVTGNNQENVAYPSGLCAERVAIYAAGAQYPNIKIKTIAIFAYSETFSVEYPISPCGACRQAIAEYENRYQQNIQIILKGDKGPIYLINSIKELLPLVFNETRLKKK